VGYGPWSRRDRGDSLGVGLKVKRQLSKVLAALLFAAGAASGALPAAAQAEPAAVVTLLHWWTAPSELAALNALGEALARQHPDLRLRATDARSHGGGARIFLAVSAAAAAGTPPDAIFVNGGAPLQPYVDAGLLAPLDALWKSEGLEQVIPPAVRVMNRIGDHYYAVPVDVHRDNLVWFNGRLLEEHGIAPESLDSWSALFGAAEKLRAAGLRHPVAFGSNWTMSLALEGILAGMGAATYADFINGRMTAADDPRLLEAFGILKTLLSYSAPDHLSRSWSEEIQAIAAGDAALCLMGDWANGEFALAGQRYGSDYGAIPVPGTRGMYGATVDAFAAPGHGAPRDGATRFLQVTASREALDAFSHLKGSISPRTDADPAHYTAYQRSALAAFKGAKVIYPNLAGGSHDAFKAGVDNAMTVFQSDGDVRAAVATVAGLAARSQNKFTRVWKLE